MFRFDDDKYYSMPPYFGGSPVRRNKNFGEHRAVHLSCAAEAAQLERFLPEGFSLISPELRYTFCECTRASSVPDDTLNLFLASVFVRYDGNDEGLTGLLPLVMWADRVSVILSFREEAGLPALHADTLKGVESEGRFRGSVGRGGVPFCEVEFQEGAELTADDIERMHAETPNRWFGWRYIPNTGAPGAALSHATVSPYMLSIKHGRQGTGRMVWHPEVFEHCPSQATILSCLSTLPVCEPMQGIYAACTMRAMPELARPLP